MTVPWAEPSPPAPPPPPRRRAYPALIALAVFGALALVAVSIVAIRERNRGDDARQELARLEEQAGRQTTLTSPPTTAEGEGTEDTEGTDGLEGLLDDLLGEGGVGGIFEDLLGGDLGELLACMDGTVLFGGGSGAVEGDDVGEQVDAIADAVEEDRELTFTEEVEPVYLDSAAIEARIEELTRRDYPADVADLDRRYLAALGVIPLDTDLLELQIDLLQGQVAGFYDPDTGELVVRTDDPDEPLDANGQMILSHELEHALADQNLELPIEDPDAGDTELDSDGDAARRALVEGDATLVMQRFATGAMAGGGLDSLLEPSAVSSQAALDAAPYYLEQSLLFSYLEGLSFVCGRYADGGWGAVDDAYRDLPSTTAQILFPDRYEAGEEAVEPAALTSPGEGWDLARDDTFGAAELLWLIGAPGDDTSAALDDVEERVAAWGGGRSSLYTDGGRSALGLSLVQREGESGLCDTVVAWYEAAFGGQEGEGDERLVSDGDDQDAVVRCDGDEVQVGIGPDLEVARAVVA